MIRAVFGAAGHIDHGKTTLVKALTGRNLDTLEEEKRRGITISPGFTWIDLGGVKAGMIDVPGHERFIKNMIAGAAGIDLAMLVVAATEGVKPQTLEHLEILETLGLSSGIIVLTKCALADELMTELCEEDVKDHVKGTFLEQAEIVRTDSVTGLGIDELREKLKKLAAAVRNRNANAAPRLNIDRVFTKKGFGAVITGTLQEGTININDDLIVYPKGHIVKARGIQVHESPVESAFAGQRAAVNLSGVKPADLNRGDVLTTPGLEGTLALDVKLRLFKRAGRDVKFWDRLRLYVGTKELFCRAAPFEGEIKAGAEGYCQLRLEEEVFCKKDDRFVARLYSPMETIGGGVILDTKPRKHSRMTDELLESLLIKDSGGAKDLLEGFIKDHNPVDIKKAADYASVSVDEAAGLLSELVSEGLIFESSGMYYHADYIDALREKAVTSLKEYHAKNPLKAGMPKEQLKSKVFTDVGQRQAEGLLGIFAGEGIVKISGGMASLSSFRIRLNLQQKNIKAEIEKKLMDGGFAPPPLNEINISKNHAEVLELLSGDSVIILDKNTAMHVHYYNESKKAAVSFLKENGEMTLAQFRDVLGVSRKYAQLLLERFDDERITVRAGDIRKLRDVLEAVPYERQ